jgi:hypothetical protein
MIPPVETAMNLRPKRRFQRIRVDRPALVRLVDPEPDQYPHEDFAKARVVGVGGCMVESSFPLPYGSLTDVLIALGERVVRADGRVVWESECDSGRHEVGLEFLRISNDDRALIESLVSRAGSAA